MLICGTTEGGKAERESLEMLLIRASQTCVWVALGNVSGRRWADRTVVTWVGGPEGYLVTWAFSSKAAASLALSLEPQELAGR